MATECWFCEVEFAFDVDTEPSKLRYQGDTEVDFARRAFEEGLRPHLAKAFPGNDGIGWRLMYYPNVANVRSSSGVVAKKEN